MSAAERMLCAFVTRWNRNYVLVMRKASEKEQVFMELFLAIFADLWSGWIYRAVILLLTQ